MEHTEVHHVVSGRVHRPGAAVIEVIERDRPLPSVVPLRGVQLEAGGDADARVRHVQRHEHLPAHGVGVVHARRARDDVIEDAESEIGILEDVVGRVHKDAVAGDRLVDRRRAVILV